MDHEQFTYKARVKDGRKTLNTLGKVGESFFRRTEFLSEH